MTVKPARSTGSPCAPSSTLILGSYLLMFVLFVIWLVKFPPPADYRRDLRRR